MSNIIIYGSHYGTTKQYAEELSKKTNIQAISYENVKNINNIRNNIKSQVSKEVLEKAKIFHLRGGIDYSKLNFVHKGMMKLLYNAVKNLSQEKQTAENRAMIETYNKKVDFIDFSSLDKIVSEI